MNEFFERLRKKNQFSIRYGIGLLAVQKDKIGSTIQLNPGSRHTIRGSDICYYMSITEEEQMTLLTKEQSKRRASISHIATSVAGIGKQRFPYVSF